MSRAAPRLTNAELGERLERIADLLELTDANPFRVRAYRTAAETVEAHPEPLADLRSAGTELTTLKGVGADLARTLEELLREGRCGPLDALEREVPPGLLEVRRVPGVGPKRAVAVWRKLGVTDLEGLERAARAGELAGLPGFGERTQAKVLAGVERVRSHASRRLLVEVEGVVGRLVDTLRRVPGALRVEAAGSVRRGAATVGDVDLVASAEDPDRMMSALLGYDGVLEVLGTGPTKTSVVLAGGLQVDLRVVPAETFGAALVHFTGSKAHTVELRARAQERGLSLSEYGLVPEDDPSRRLAGGTEDEVYRALELEPIPPELREGRGEVAAAAEGRLPRPLLLGDVRGDLHLHTTWSDGTASLEELVEACVARGYAYMAVTDHSQALRMTGGLDEAKLARQHAALDALEAARAERGAPPIEILRGLEVDVLRDGSLDLGDDALERLDIVIVSVHSHFELSRAAQTERILRALTHPRVGVLAHPTGRILGRRDPIDLDLAEILAAAAEHGVAVELNASPYRLDLGDVELMQALRAGCTVVVNTDAHALTGLDDLRYGITTARRAWLEPRHVLNTWPVERVRAFLRRDAGAGRGAGPGRG